ncbi:uncharacterized protein LOC110181440 [Drosophila serrata]|uniref:uncharacterized protein LOC110179876 n=1 Tax=Drosophila serrata TaxID=7274 RepID=UPI000A1D0530|nr:uncharacterized protein LOC110179876 [Drosophila serrata]XP_020804842.1 uncharacterized protein LOC110181440 [Drosophila serrata]KAH8356791.1 hypothetical protein KR200_004083 [Drosophila serrata]
MCPKEPVESSLLPDCRIANRVLLFTLLQTLQAEERRMEEVDVQLRDRYDVFLQVLANYPVPVEEGPDDRVYYDADDLIRASESSRNETFQSSLDSDSGQIPVTESRIPNRVN